MIHLLYGKDDYQVRKALAAIRAELAARDDMLASNTTVLDGAALTPAELLAHATAVPFLASDRLVIVEGLLRALGEGRGGRRRKKGGDDDPLEPWRQAAARLADPATMPPSTTLVLVEGEIARKNPAVAIFAPIARAVEHAPLRGAELERWIAATAKEKGLKLAPGAVRMLAEGAGGNLWALENDLEKIAAYCGAAAADEATVSQLASWVRETKAWGLGDAVVAGQERQALTLLRRLLRDGEAPPLLAFMIARGYRQLLLVKDMRERRLTAEEIERAAGVPSFRLGTVAALASRYSWPDLRRAYQRLLEADLSVKRGLQDDESALQLLVHELCALAPGRAAPRPAYARPAPG